MAPIRTILSGRELALSLDTGVDPFIDLFSVNIVTGAVSSSWIPAEWLPFMEEAVAKLDGVVPPLDRTSLSYLGRLVKIAPMDDSTLTASAISSGDLQTFRITPFGGVQPSVLLVQLPHSITGFFGTNDTASGLGPPVILNGTVIGPSDANQLVNFGPGAGTYGDAATIPVLTLDDTGRVAGVTPTALPFAPAGVATFGAYSLNAASTVVSVGTPLVVPFDRVEDQTGCTLVAGSRLTVPSNGVYELSFSPQLAHAGGAASQIFMWPRLNGTTPVVRGSSEVKLANNGDELFVYIALVLRLNAGDYIEWLMESSGNGPTTLVTLAGAGAGATARPSNPAVIASVKFIGS